MIAIPGNVRVWLATGHTDMRRGFPSLARLVQESLKRDPHAGDLYVFRGRRGDLIKIIWHDGQGACLFTKRLERGRFLWPSTMLRKPAWERCLSSFLYVRNAYILSLRQMRGYIFYC